MPGTENNISPKVQQTKRGRPSKFKEDGIEVKRVSFDLLKLLYSKGLTDKQVANLLGLEEKTINNWKIEHPEFLQALKDWKEEADSIIEKSLYERANGYSHPDVHITNYQGVITETPIIKHYPPDPTSMIFWLKNRKPKEWRDKTEISLEGVDEILLKRKKTNE